MRNSAPTAGQSSESWSQRLRGRRAGGRQPHGDARACRRWGPFHYYGVPDTIDYANIAALTTPRSRTSASRQECHVFDFALTTGSDTDHFVDINKMVSDSVA